MRNFLSLVPVGLARAFTVWRPRRHEVRHMVVMVLLILTLGDELHEIFIKGHPVSASKMKEWCSLLI